MVPHSSFENLPISALIPSSIVKARSPWHLGALLILVPLALVIILVKTQILGLFHHPAASMAPTIPAGSDIFATRTFRDDFQRGDLVIFRPPINPDSRFIMRVQGIGGDVIVIKGDELTINGLTPVSPAGLRAAAPGTPEQLNDRHQRLAPRFPLTVPPDHYFVLGDNFTNSLDSRYWGCISRDDITHIPHFVE